MSSGTWASSSARWRILTSSAAISCSRTDYRATALGVRMRRVGSSRGAGARAGARARALILVLLLVPVGSCLALGLEPLAVGIGMFWKPVLLLLLGSFSVASSSARSLRCLTRIRTLRALSRTVSPLVGHLKLDSGEKGG